MAHLIGTAGHVDHGKTALIQALTGIDADRLPEEKRRGMTIDIGFAYLDLDGIGRVSIVDVPGHERFITNMLVGALGTRLAVLCVSADAGVMPQTREHLAILDLLPVQRLVVAYTRSDLADSDSRELVEMDVSAMLEETRFRDVPRVFTSAKTGEGLEELRGTLAGLLLSMPPIPITPWVLPIDRVFVRKGFGAVVTGTLGGGPLKVGSSAVLQPGGQSVRIRGLQVHGEAVETAEPGQRVAVNVSGADDAPPRGAAMGAPDALFETTVLDLRVRWVGEVRHGETVRLAIGSADAIGKAFLSDTDRGLVQVRLQEPVAAMTGLPIVLRRHSPPDLLAGGTVEVPQATPRRKGAAATQVKPADAETTVLVALAEAPNGLATDHLCRLAGRTPQAMGDVFERLQREGKIRGFAGLWLSADGFQAAVGRLREALRALHAEQPSVAYQSRERAVAKAGLPWSGKPLDRIVAALAAEGQLRVQGTQIQDADFRLTLSARQRALLDRAKEELERQPVTTASAHDIARALAVPPPAIEEILRLGQEAGEVVRLADGIAYTAGQIEAIKGRLAEAYGDRPFSAAEARDLLGASRKYAIPLLEHLDAVRFTLRTGDQRRLVDPPR